jgi:regulator of sirC expression with transglutaminase-like and TPR domain
MNPTAPVPAQRTVSEAEKRALLALLEDEDAVVYDAVRQRILDCGAGAAGWLRPRLLSDNPVVRRRAQSIVRHFERQDADNSFLTFCVTHGEDLDLEAGLWALARTRYPEINIEAYRALLDEFADALREPLAGSTSPITVLARINEMLFDRLGFHGNQENYYDPDNSYLNRIMDRRMGNPIGLATLYWLVGRRLCLPIVGIGLPGHFLCRYQSNTEAYFIDAFNRGKLLTRADCIKYLQGSGHGFQESFLAPATPGRTLLRVCSNLHQIYSRADDRESIARFQRYLVALAR